MLLLPESRPFAAALVFVLFAALLVLIGSLFLIPVGKGFTSAGLLLTVAGVIQLWISDLITAFRKRIEPYLDEKQYPYGPPSSLTRQIIDNPDQPGREWFRRVVFHDARTGFWFIVVGTLLQVVAVWF